MDGGTAAQDGIPGLLVRRERPEDYGQTEALVREAFWNRYAQSAETHGREVDRGEIAAWGGFLMLTSDKEKAQALMTEHKWFWDEWFIPLGQKMPNVLIGSADEIADQIGRAHDRLGFNELFLMYGQGHLDPEQNNDELEKFARLVAPRFGNKNELGVYL